MADVQIASVSSQDLGHAELFALPFLILLLFLVFRGLRAAMVPLIGAIFAIAMTLGVMGLIIIVLPLSVFALNLVIALGLGLSVDFSLLIVSRFREELQRQDTVVAAYVIFGVGAGLVNAPIATTAMSGMPLDQAGVAGAVASTSRQVGSALGVAVTGSIVALGTGATFVGASHGAWYVVAACATAVCLLGFVSTGQWARMTATRSGERLEARTKEMAR